MRRSLVPRWIGVILPLLGLIACAPQPNKTTIAPSPPVKATPSKDHASVEPLNTWVSKYIDAYQAWYAPNTFRGNLLIAKGDTPQLTRGIEVNYPERFLIGSITKSMTAIAIMQLLVKGKLKLSDSIRMHIKELPQSFEKITLEQILSHRSGMASFTSDQALMKTREQHRTQAQMIAQIAKMPHLHEPGKTFSYSNSGYYLLGVVIQRTTGQSWAQYLDTFIFKPANMKDTNALNQDTLQGWTLQENTLVKAREISLSVPFSAGAVVSTAGDLFAFSRALFNETLLPRTVVQKMWDYGKDLKDPSNYGLGFFSMNLPNGERVVGHNGGIDGFSSSMFFTPSGEWTAVTLANSDQVPTDLINLDLLSMASTDQAKLPAKPLKTRPFDSKLAARLSGKYQMKAEDQKRLAKMLPAPILESLTTGVWSGEQSYQFKPAGQPGVPLQQLDDGSFAFPRIGLEITLIEKDGKITGLTFRQNGLSWSYDKQ